MLAVDEAGLLADLAYCAVQAKAADADQRLQEAATACDRAGRHDHGTWAWKCLADRTIDRAQSERDDRPDAAEELFLEALMCLERSEAHHCTDDAADRASLAQCFRARVVALRGLGRWDQAAREAQRSSRLATEGGEAMDVVQCAAMAAHACVDAQDVRGALLQADKVIAAAPAAREEADDSSDVAVHVLNARMARVWAVAMRDGFTAIVARDYETLLADLRAAGKVDTAGMLQVELTHILRDTGRARPGTTVIEQPDYDVGEALQSLLDQLDGLTSWSHAAFLEPDVVPDHEGDGGESLEARTSVLEQLFAQAPDGMYKAQIALHLVRARIDRGDHLAPLLRLIDESLAAPHHPAQRFVLTDAKATIYTKVGALRAAGQTYRELLEWLPADRTDERRTAELQLARSLVWAGQLDEALQMVAELEGGTPDSGEQRVHLLHIRADIHHRLERVDRAVTALRAALSLLDETLGTDEDYSATLAHTRAMLQVDLAHSISAEDPGEAVELYETALVTIRDQGNVFHEAPASEGLLLARGALGVVSDGERIAELSRILDLRIANGDVEGEMATRMNLTWALIAAGHLRAATHQLDIVVASHRERDLPLLLVIALNSRASVLHDRRDPAAVRDAVEACELIERARESFMSDEERTAFIGVHADSFALLAAMRFEAEDLPGVLAAGERGRALGLVDLASGAALRDELPPAVLEELDGARTELEHAAIELSDDRRSDPSGVERYEHAAQRLRGAERAIRAVTPGLRTATIPPATVEALQRGPLANGAGLVVYSLPAHGDAMALCITSDTIAAVAIEDGGPMIRILGAELALSLAARLGRPLHTHLLHQLLLSPVVEVLGDRPLIVVPDAELHQIPFAVLTESPIDDHDENVSADAMGSDQPRDAATLADVVDTLPPLDWSSPDDEAALADLTGELDGGGHSDLQRDCPRQDHRGHVRAWPARPVLDPAGAGKERGELRVLPHFRGARV